MVRDKLAGDRVDDGNVTSEHPDRTNGMTAAADLVFDDSEVRQFPEQHIDSSVGHEGTNP